MQIDSLEVQISAQATTADKALKNLSSRLDKINASLGRINGDGLARMASGIKRLSDAMAAFSSNTKTTDFSRLSRNLATINKIDTSKFSDIASKMSQLSKSLNGIQNINININKGGFENLSKSAKEAEKSIVNSSGEILSSFIKVENSAKKDIKKKVSFDTSEYKNVIKELSTKFSNAGSGFKVSGTLSEMEKQADSLSKRLESLTQKEEKIISIGQTAPNSKMFTNLQYDITETVNKLDKLGDAISSAKAKASDMSNLKINKWTDNIDVSKETASAPKVSQISPSSIGFNPDLMATLYGESARGIKNYEQFVKQFGNTAKSAFSSFSNEATASKEKTALLGNKVEELREKLKTMKVQGLNFGDAEFDKTYSELNKAEKELREYKTSLEGAGKASFNFANVSLPNFRKVTDAIHKMGSGVSSALKKIGNISSPLKTVSGTMSRKSTS